MGVELGVKVDITGLLFPSIVLRKAHNFLFNFLFKFPFKFPLKSTVSTESMFYSYFRRETSNSQTL